VLRLALEEERARTLEEGVRVALPLNLHR
jgi:hypothetical protein